MEITLEALISIVTLLVGGTGIGGYLFYKQKKREEEAKARLAEAEAKLKEAEAKQAEVVAVNNMQEAYEKMFTNVNAYLDDTKEKVEGMRQERDHYKQERNELREQVDKLTKLYYELKTEGEKERSDMKRDIARLGRKVEVMTPFMCGDLTCKIRQRVTISDDGTVKTAITKKEQKEIEPYNDNSNA